MSGTARSFQEIGALRRLREIGGVLVIAGAVFGWLSIRSDATGQAGRYLGSFLRHTFGQGADVPPSSFFSVGLAAAAAQGQG